MTTDVEQREVANLKELKVGDNLAVFIELKQLYLMGAGSKILATNGLTCPEKAYTELFPKTTQTITPGMARKIIWEKFRLMTEEFISDDIHFILMVVKE